MKPFKERFWDKIEKTTSPNGCWEWRGCKTNKRFKDNGKSSKNGGYGKITHRGKVYYVHRLSWELHYGPIPEGMFVLHKCDNKQCVNPEHLELGDSFKNMRDAKNRGRLHSLGEDNRMSKLTWEKVREIRASKLSQIKLAKLYGVNRQCILKIKNNKSWIE